MSDTEEKFIHKIDKSWIPTCNIMGVHVAAINMEWLLEFTHKYIKLLSGDYMCMGNVHTTIMSYENEEYCAIQNGGILTAPDGGPLSTVGKSRGYRSMERTTGPSYLEEILKVSVEHNYRHFFYGSTEDTLRKILDTLKMEFPEIQVAGMVSPPFRALTEEEDNKVIEYINQTNPDFVWIGLGAPKQERWMAAHQGKVKGFMIGVGAAFDYLAGNIDRAPEWMQKMNLEWLFRLLQDPRRLIGRYFYTNLKFIWNICVKRI